MVMYGAQRRGGVGYSAVVYYGLYGVDWTVMILKSIEWL